MKPKNDSISFGKLLEQLMTYSSQKNSALAATLMYDVSYISKWMNEASLPSNKNIASISKTSARFIIETSEESQINELFLIYNVSNTEQLKTEMELHLEHAYKNSILKNEKNAVSSLQGLAYNSLLSVNPRLQRLQLQHQFSMQEQKPTDLIIFIDLFSFGREDKLTFMGQNTADSDAETSTPDGSRFRFMLSLDRTNMDLIFDVILFINMLTNLSKQDSEFYYYPKVPCSLLMVSKDQCLHMSLLTENHRCILSNTTTDRSVVNDMYHTMESMLHTQAIDMFQKVTIEKMITEHIYMQSLISLENRWVIGKMAEHFLPKELFDRLITEVFGENPVLANEIKKLHQLLNNVVSVSNVQILIYESAIQNYLVTGELDFFNHKVILSMEEREKHLRYMIQLLTENNNLEIRLIEGNILSEFKSNANPCLYMSDSLVYLRLNNGLYKNNLLIVKNKILRQIFSDFYQKIWNEPRENILADKNTINKKLQHYIHTFKLFENL